MGKNNQGLCCGHGRFPTFAIILLAVGIIWMLNELAVITIPIPWIPVVLIIVAIGMIINRYMGE